MSLVGLPILALFCTLMLAGTAAQAQAPTTNRPWAYLLLSDSTLTDECLVCGRPTILEPMRGTFQLRLLEYGPLSTRYALENISFTAGSSRTYRISGSGTLQIGGEVALVQTMFLQLLIDDGFNSKVCYFTNGPSGLTRPWPMLDVSVVQTNGTFTQQYSLRVTAAPVREIWFSTANFFTATSGPATFIRGGDLLSTGGRIVKRNADLFTSVGAYPPGPDLGLDAVDMLPGGEIAFSLGTDITSTTLGTLHHGDLLSTRGHILYRNQDLLANFSVMPPASDAGLDAAKMLPSGEALFSISSNVFSERLGITLHRGDLLSTTGGVARSNQQLLSLFHPAKSADYGLDAIYIWPGGEIWFSTEQGFQDNVLGPISDGDLLSDQGYIVLRNSDLVRAFTPADNTNNFGLDALYVITDAMTPAPAPRLSITATNTQTRSATLTWQGLGRVFQLERATTVTGPFQPLSPIVPDLSYEDVGALTNRAQGYYRLHQW